jgi:hypothetical protein
LAEVAQAVAAAKLVQAVAAAKMSKAKQKWVIVATSTAMNQQVAALIETTMVVEAEPALWAWRSRSMRKERAAETRKEREPP